MVVLIKTLLFMRKKFFLVMLALVMCGANALAQSSLMATLSHDGKISTFYGSSALQQAHAAAANGDVITLSSGSFAGVDITKAVTIRGAGMEVDTVHAIEPTVLTGNFNINIADSIADILTMEGVYHNQKIEVSNLKNAMFLKCRFYNFSYATGTPVMKDLNFINCRIAYEFYGCRNASASFVNTVVKTVNCIYSGHYSLINSIVFSVDVDDSEFKNCILVDIYSKSSCSYYNNLFINDNNALNNIPNTTNVQVKKDDARIANLLGDYSDSNPYELSEEAKNIVKGTDGTEVGIYGGSIPYDATPTNPRITKFEVAQKTTADGKLSVDIEVNGEE